MPAVLTNTSGGVTGGDEFQTRIEVGSGAKLTVTTQAAERAYRAQPGQIGRVKTRLKVASGARVNWLPQETILFDGCDFSRRLSVDLASDASVLIVEPLVFGRTAMGETIATGRFRDGIELRIADRPVFSDRTFLDGNITTELARPAVAAGASAMALVLYKAADAESRLPAMRALLPQTGGASLLRQDLMVIRLLAAEGFALRQDLLPVIDVLNDDHLPRPWMI